MLAARQALQSWRQREDSALSVMEDCWWRLR